MGDHEQDLYDQNWDVHAFFVFRKSGHFVQKFIEPELAVGFRWIDAQLANKNQVLQPGFVDFPMLSAAFAQLFK